MAVLKTLGIILLIGIFGGIIFLRATPTGREIYNEWQESLKETDETTYENQVEIENLARTQIVAYESAFMQYGILKVQCETTENALDCERASAKLVSVNNLAIAFNEYMLINSHYWEDNIPDDINRELPIITP